MSKRGFTLVELLAVIVILAIIALIATPIVLNIISSAEKGANKNSAYGILKGAELYYAQSMLDTSKISNINGTTNVIEEIEMSGEKPESGEVYINNKGQIALAVVYDKVCYKKNFTDRDLSESEDIENCKITSSQSETIAYYAFGDYDTFEDLKKESKTNYQDVININETGNNVFVKLEGDQLSVCIYRNNTLECFKNNNYAEESVHLQNVFGADICNSESSIVICNKDFACAVYSGGDVACADIAGYSCNVFADGRVNCG